jgi:uncharacterized protein YecT (DUF1311 family)
VKIVLLNFMMLLAADVYSASFDCKKTSTRVETLICDDLLLSELDNQMSDAYVDLKEALNPEAVDALTKEQRHWIKSREKTCTGKDDATCIISLTDLYRKRISDILEKVGSELLPSTEELHALCEMIASSSPEKRAALDLKDESVDINNDGVRDKKEDCVSGTMNIPCRKYRAQNGNLLDIETVGFEWNDYWTYGLATFEWKGKFYNLHSYDDFFKKPAYVSFVSSDNKERVVCEFEVKQKIIASSSSNAEDLKLLCSSLAKNSLDNLSSALSNEPLSKSVELCTSCSPDTYIEKSGYLDYDNDGAPNYLIEFGYASGAGRGCDFNYFDEFDLAQEKVSETAIRKLLLYMQGVDFEARHPGCGGMRNKFVEYNGLIYYVAIKEGERSISTIQNGVFNKICTASPVYDVSVKN